MNDVEVPIKITADVDDKATSKLEQLGAAVAGVIRRATSAAEEGGPERAPAAVEATAPASAERAGQIRWIDSAGEERWSSGDSSSRSKRRRRSGGRRGRQAAEVDPMEEVQSLIDEAVKMDTKFEVTDSQRLRSDHSRTHEVEKQQDAEYKKLDRQHRKEMNEWDRQNKRLVREHEAGIQRAGRIAGSLLGRAFWDIIQGRQGTFEALFKRGGQFAVQMMSEKLFQVFFKIGDELLKKHLEGSELIKKGSEFLEKGIKKGADFLIEGLSNVVKGIAKGIGKLLGSLGGGMGGGGGPLGMIFGAAKTIAGFFMHQGGMVTAHGGLEVGGSFDNNERLVRAKVGEWVINDTAAASLKRQNPNAFAMLNQGSLPGGAGGNVTVNAKMHDMSKAAIDRFVKTELNNALLRNRVRFRN